MWELLPLYLGAFVSKLWAFVTAFALFKIEPVVRTYWPWGRAQIEKISPQWRTKIEYAILIAAFFYAGFAAWNEEHTKWQTERDLRIASEASHRKTEVVEGLKGLYSEANDLLLERPVYQKWQSYKTYADKVDAFSHRADKWLIDNMGKPAWTIMLQINTPSGFSYKIAVNKDHSDTLVSLTNIKTNLDALIQNPAWDKP